MFSADPANDVVVRIDEIKITVNDPGLRALLDLVGKGIESDADIDVFIDLILDLSKRVKIKAKEGRRDIFSELVFDESELTNPPAQRLFYDALSARLEVVTDIVSAFRSHRIPLRVDDSIETSFTARSLTEWRDRNRPAAEHGITLAKGASFYTFLHETAHALPGDVIRQILGNLFPSQEDVIESGRRWELKYPDFPGDDASLENVFTGLAGRDFRDELYAGLAEVGMVRVFSFLGAPVPERLENNMESIFEFGLYAFVREGAYLGDNHLIMYDLAAAAETAMRIKEDPNWAAGQIFDSSHGVLSMAAFDMEEKAWKKRLMTVMARLKNKLGTIYRDVNSRHPLKPALMRLHRYISVLGVDLSRPQRRAAVEERTAGERATPRAQGNPGWIASHEGAAREIAGLLFDFAAMGVRKLAQLVRNGEFEALGSLAMMVPDGDLPRFWSVLLTRIEGQLAGDGGTAVAELGDMHPVILPLVLQGYLDDANRLLPAAQNDPLFGRQWTVAMFNGIDVLSRVGDAAAIDVWIDVVEGESKMSWTRRYQRDVASILDELGTISKEGRERLEAFFAERHENFVPSRAVIDLVYELSTEGLYRPRKVKMDEIEDPYDLEERWTGARRLLDSEHWFREAFPDFPVLEQLANAASRLKERGFTAQAARLEALGHRLLRQLIAFRTDTIPERIQRSYQNARKLYRQKDSFHSHVAKLGGHETDYLPSASALAGELMLVTKLPAEYGGGWQGALEYLRRLPDGFVKTMAMSRLASEAHHLPPPEDSELAELMDIWKRSFESTLNEIPQGSSVQPDGEGIIFRAFNDSWLSRDSAGRLIYSRSDAAVLAYTQKQLYAMLSFIPLDAGGRLATLRVELHRTLVLDKTQSVIMSPNFVLPMYDPSQYVEDVAFKRSIGTKQVYLLAHDPNVIALKVAIEGAPSRPDRSWLSSMKDNIEEALRVVPPEMRAPYVSMLIEVSAMAANAGETVMEDELYERARQLGEGLRLVGEDAHARFYRFDGLNEEQRAFDLQARYRRFRATWERTALLSFARIIAGGSPNAEHYASEIRRIIENESIFDVMESSDYRDVAAMLDRKGGHSDLVFELFRRAIETRQREQFEATYDVEHGLTTAIDASGLSPEEKDELLERLATISFQRIFRSSTMRLTRSRTRESFIMEMGRMFEPVNELLDLVSRRGYVRTENTIWEALRRLCGSALKEIPDPLHPMVMSKPALLAVTRHPEMVHPDSREVVTSLVNGASELFESPFAGEGSKSYADLPGAWKIKQAYADDRTSEISRNFARMMEEMPKGDVPVDPYLLGLLNVEFTTSLEHLGGQPDDEFAPSSARVDIASLYNVKKMLSHFGVRSFAALAQARPDIVRAVFLSHLDRRSASFLSHSLIRLVINGKIPEDVRLDAFRALLRTGLISDYLRARFESAVTSKEGIAHFLNTCVHIFVATTRFRSGQKSEHLHPPDWLIAPMFEPVLSKERESAQKASAIGTLVNEEFNIREDISERDVTPYSVLNTAWQEPGEWRLRVYVNDEPYFLSQLRGAADDINSAAYERFKSGSQDIEEDVVRIYRRNNIMVRIGSVVMPEAFDRINPVLRFVIANYISLVAPSTRTLLLSALFRSQEKLGEDEVLSIFFELTGQEKLAQFLSLQEGVVPDEYRKKLSKFQEDLRPSTHQEIVDTLRRNGIQAGTDIRNGDRLVFEHAGTVGELWSAELMDGRRVAIKMLPWKKRRRNEESIRALERLSSDMQLFQQELFGGINFSDLYNRYRETLLDEMDYRREATNLGRLIGSMDAAHIGYPSIHEDLLRRDVMAMDYIEFKNIAEVGGEEGRRIVDVTGSWLARSIFRDGVFYEDFHPGNIKWEPGKDGAPGRPLVLDFGRIGELTKEQRRSLVYFLVAVQSELPDSTVHYLLSMAKSASKADRKALTGEVKAIFDKGDRTLPSSKIQNLFSVAARHGADLEPNYLQFIKAVMSWENVMRTVDPAADFSVYAAPVIVEELSREPEGGGPSSTPAAQEPSGPAAPVPPATPPVVPSAAPLPAMIPAPGLPMAAMGLGMFARMPMPMVAPMPINPIMF